MMLVAGATVVHQVAWLSGRREQVVTRCGLKIRFNRDTLFRYLSFRESASDYVESRVGRFLPLCSHCPNRAKPKRPK